MLFNLETNISFKESYKRRAKNGPTDPESMRILVKVIIGRTAGDTTREVR